MGERDNGDVLIYYASSDTRMHVASSSWTGDRLRFAYPEDGMRSAASVQQRIQLIERNLRLAKKA